MCAHISFSGLKSLISKILETKSRAVITGSLLGISDPEGNVIKSVEDTNGWSLGWLFVVHEYIFNKSKSLKFIDLIFYDP